LSGQLSCGETRVFLCFSQNVRREDLPVIWIRETGTVCEYCWRYIEMQDGSTPVRVFKSRKRTMQLLAFLTFGEAVDSPGKVTEEASAPSEGSLRHWSFFPLASHLPGAIGRKLGSEPRANACVFTETYMDRRAEALYRGFSNSNYF
jgi:hypothetical protein